MSDELQTRWALASLDTAKFTVTIADQQAKRKKIYHIPYLTHAILKGELLLAATSFNKTMEINLLNGSRRFIA